MDPRYAIGLAKTEFREGYNAGDVERVLSVFAREFTDMSDGQPSFFGPDAPAALRQRLASLFNDHTVKMVPVVIDVLPLGELVFELGWHKVTVISKKTGEQRYGKYRYAELWAKQPDGAWKIVFWMTNRELPPRMAPLPEALPQATAMPS